MNKCTIFTGYGYLDNKSNNLVFRPSCRMDVFDAFVIRALERILVIFCGGLSIYLGYRLFLDVPYAKEADGHFTFAKGVEVKLSRIGPGAFFALFGAALVAIVAYKSVTISEEPASAYGKNQKIETSKPMPSSGTVEPEELMAAQTSSRVSWSGATSGMSNTTRKQDLNRLRGNLVTLAQLEGMVTQKEGAESLFLPAQIEELRRTLIEAEWESDLGDWQQFHSWLDNGQPTPPPPKLRIAVELYNHGRQ
jgi:hypothetical protein